MADQLGSAVLTLSIDDKQYNAGLQRAKQNLGGLVQTGKSGGLSGLTSRLTTLGATATGVAAGVAAVGVAVAGIGFAATQTAGSIQKLNAAFVGLTGSAEAARQLRQDLFTLSKTTPFKNEEILQAAQRFLAVGVEVDKLQGTINRVGAIAAQSGQPLERLALIYAQVYAKGRLQGEENLQLLEAGVDLTQELSAVTGKSGKALQDAMSKGQISINDFNKALLLATGKMSALQLAGRAVDVQFNNVFDNLGQLFGGFAQAIAPALSASFKVINDIFDAAFPSLESITKFFEPLTQAAERFSKTLEGNPQLIAAIANGFKSIGSIIVDNIAIGLDTISSILSKIDGKELIKGLIQVELLLRKALLASRALSATIIKNAELTFRGITNPVQFGKDIFAAGGFQSFIEKQYGEVYQYWTAAAQDKPLPFPEVQAKPGSNIKGDLSNKPNLNEERIAYLRQQVERLKPAPVQEINNIRAAIDAARKDRQAAFTNYSNLLNDPKASRPEQIAAGKELVAAAIAFKTVMVDGARQIADVVTGAANRLTQARLELSGIQANPDEGLNRFLRPEQRQVRLNTATARLGPDLERSISIATKLLKEQGLSLDNSLINELRSTIAGARGDKKQFGTINGRPFFGAAGPEASVASFKKIDDFITAVQKENESRNNLSKAQADVAAINKELLGVNSDLAKQVTKLTEKTWAVTVNVDSGGGVKTFGDVLNSAVQ